MSQHTVVPSSPAQLTGRGGPDRPAWKDRLAAAVYYFGLAPVLRPLRFRRDDPFVQHHAAQALATILVLLAVLLGGFLYLLGLSYLLVYRRDLYECLPPMGRLAAPVRDTLLFTPVLLAWLLLWLGGLLLALVGSRHTLPLIGRVARRPLLLRLAFAGNVSLLVVAALTTVLALHASSLTRDDDKPAAVYLLYDDMGFVPRWVMNVGFYRISLAAQERWGPGNVVVAPLDQHHLELALRHGRFVYLACHGVDGEITTSELRITPPPRAEAGETPMQGLYVANDDAEHGCGPWTLLEAGPNLRLVYNSACDSGRKADEWEQALAPAEVRTFGRLSAVVEHLVWLWSEGPRRVREME
jgi:uncharacterized membrane protein